MKKFENIPQEAIDLVQDFLVALRQKTAGFSVSRNLPLSIEDANELPNMPKHNVEISFQWQDTWFYIILNNNKIELSDSFRDVEESYTRFKFLYEVEGYSENEGELNEFRFLLFDSLREVPVHNISFSLNE